MLQEKYDATRQASAEGGINEEPVRVIVRAAEKKPATATAEQVVSRRWAWWTGRTPA
jgi:hypothetical protein